jgi:tRNA(Ile)-lysidine synthase
MQLLERVRQTIRRHDLARADTRVVVALSGGSDSVALAHLLRALDLAGELRVVGLAHFNHQLRPAASGDESFCADVAAALEQPLLVDREDVRDLARRERRSIEDAARRARHRFLERARGHFDADVIALGHTRDDQAETFLLRLLRGAGARGLAAMHPRRGALIRPLLDCRRATLQEYLVSRHVAYIHDESNEDLSIPRNRVRAELLPFLEQRFNPSIVDVLADEADLAREDWQWMAAAEDELWSRACRREGDTWRMAAGALGAAPVALARLAIRRAMIEASGGRAVSFAHIEEAVRLVREGGAPVDLPGQRMQRDGGDLVLTARPEGAIGRPAGQSAGAANLFQYPLSIPGEIRLEEAACVLSAEVAPSEGAVDRNAISTGGALAVVRLDRCGKGLSVRNRRPGDRFRPPGLEGRTKLQDYFVNRKIARERRDAVPLVVDDADRIVWVAGHAIDEDFRVTDPAQAVLVLRLKLLGGPA